MNNTNNIYLITMYKIIPQLHVQVINRLADGSRSLMVSCYLLSVKKAARTQYSIIHYCKEAVLVSTDYW